MKIFFALCLFWTASTASATSAPISIKELSQLKTLDEKNYDGAAGKNLKLLYFWATWCPECKEKMKRPLKEVAANTNYNFLFINTEKDLGLVKNFVEKEQVPFHVLTDFDKSVRKSLKVFSVPQWVLLKRSGDSFEVLASESGFDYEKVKSLVAQALKGSPN